MRLLTLFPLQEEPPEARSLEELRVGFVCGDEPGAVCEAVFRMTGNAGFARFADALIPPLFRIALILLIAYLAHRIIKRLIRRFVAGMKQEGMQRLSGLRSRSALYDSETGPLDLERSTMRVEALGSVLRSVTSVIIWSIALLMILAEVGIALGPLIAGAGIAGIALGFGSQTLVRDFLSGIFMLVEDQYGIGDVVDLGEAAGKVEAISLRTTRIRDVEGTVWHIPNGEITRVGNKSQQWARSLLDIGVAYETDIELAQQVIKRVAVELWQDEEFGDLILEEPEVWGVEAFGASEILIRLVMKVKPAKQWVVNRELRRRLKPAFDAEGIEIPFPQRTVWIKSDEEADKNGSAPRKRTARKSSARKSTR